MHTLVVPYSKPTTPDNFRDYYVTTAAMAAARASPHGQRVAADVGDYATGGAVIIHCPQQDGAG